MSNKNAQILTNIKQLIEEAMRNEIDNDPEVNKNVIDSMACLYQTMTHNFPIDGIACKDTEALRADRQRLETIIDKLKMAYKLKSDRQDLADDYLRDVSVLESVEPEKPTVCRWTKVPEEIDYYDYETSCGQKHASTADIPDEGPRWKCPYCGRPIETKEE